MNDLRLQYWNPVQTKNSRGSYYIRPQQPRRLDGKPQILMWILMWKKGKNWVYLYEKLSILNIAGARLIFMNMY